MAKCLISPHGGVNYLTEIKAYESLNAIPLIDIPNAIAIITPIAIPDIDSGGIRFQSYEPITREDGTPRQIGDLWFVTFTRSNTPFDIVKGAQVCCIAVKQFNGSAYIDRIAKINYNAAWIPLSLFLHFGASTCDTVSGGWQPRALQYNSGFVGLLPTIVYGPDYVNADLNYVTNRAGIYEIKNDINLTNFATLKVDGYSNHDGISRHAYIYISPRNISGFESGYAGRFQIGTTREIRTFDISGCNNNYNIFIGLLAQNTNSNPFLRIYSLELI